MKSLLTLLIIFIFVGCKNYKSKPVEISGETIIFDTSQFGKRFVQNNSSKNIRILIYSNNGFRVIIIPKQSDSIIILK